METLRDKHGPDTRKLPTARRVAFHDPSDASLVFFSRKIPSDSPKKMYLSVLSNPSLVDIWPPGLRTPSQTGTQERYLPTHHTYELPAADWKLKAAVEPFIRRARRTLQLEMGFPHGDDAIMRTGDMGKAPRRQGAPSLRTMLDKVDCGITVKWWWYWLYCQLSNVRRGDLELMLSRFRKFSNGKTNYLICYAFLKVKISVFVVFNGVWKNL